MLAKLSGQILSALNNISTLTYYRSPNNVHKNVSKQEKCVHYKLLDLRSWRTQPTMYYYFLQKCKKTFIRCKYLSCSAFSEELLFEVMHCQKWNTCLVRADPFLSRWKKLWRTTHLYRWNFSFEFLFGAC